MDLNRNAFRIVKQLTAGNPDKQQDQVSAARKKAGVRGGTARAVALSRQRRIEIARQANKARWQKGKRVT